MCKYLEGHPDICFSVIKEVHYFSIEDLYERGIKYYHSFFPEYKGQPIVASSDTYLLMDHLAIKRIKKYNPEMKIIVLLRDPVDRAYSSYNYSVNYGHHPAYSGFLDSLEFEKDIENIENIVHRNNLGHFYGSLYHYHLSQWVKEFPKENLLVLNTNLMRNDPLKFKDEICSFLKIGDFDFTNLIENKLNPNAIPKSKAFEQFFLNRDNFLRKLIRSIVPSFLKRWIIHSHLVEKVHDLNRDAKASRPLTDHERKTANQYFKDDLEKLDSEFGIRF